MSIDKEKLERVKAALREAIALAAKLPQRAQEYHGGNLEKAMLTAIEGLEKVMSVPGTDDAGGSTWQCGQVAESTLETILNQWEEI